MKKFIFCLIVFSFTSLSSGASSGPHPLCEKYPNRQDSTPLTCFNKQWRPGSSEPSYFVHKPGCGTSIIFPNCINGHPWTEISEGMFKGLGLTQVILSVFTNKIGAHAFQNNKLTKLTLPGVITLGEKNDPASINNYLEVGAYAFEGNLIEEISITPKSQHSLFCRRAPLNNEIKFQEYSFANNKIKSLNFVSSFTDENLNWSELNLCAGQVVDGLFTVWNFAEGAFSHNNIETVTFKGGSPLAFALDHSWPSNSHEMLKREKNIFANNNIKEVILDFNSLSHKEFFNRIWKIFSKDLNYLDLFKEGLAQESYLKIRHSCPINCDTIIKTFDTGSESSCMEICPEFLKYDIHNKFVIPD